ncbi:MAG: hypothetical protein Q9187_003459 [Circinaria calcarea]
MARFDPDLTQLRSLQDKVVVLTGGANGIGAATVEAFYAHGALIAFGDINDEAGRIVAGKYDSKRVHFVRMDVTKYGDNLALFQLAFKEFGRVDHAISNAGVMEQGNIFDPNLTIESVQEPANSPVLDVNLIGVVHFTRIATAYLHHNAEPTDDKSITLLGSSTSYFVHSIPGGNFMTYAASKHAVIGLMRSLATYVQTTFGIRVNAVCPFATDTGMLAPVKELLLRNNIPVNKPEDVAGTIVELAAGKHASCGDEAEACNGLAVVVAGGKRWEVEESLERTRNVWMGPEAAGLLDALGRNLMGKKLFRVETAEKTSADDNVSN